MKINHFNLLKNLFCLFFLLFAGFFLPVNVANADNSRASPVKIVDNPKNFQPKIDENVLKQLLMADGVVNKAEYEKFWQMMGATNQQEKRATIDLITRDFLVFTEFNLEVLECAQKAWMLRKTIKCSRAEAVLNEVVKNIPNQDGSNTSLMQRVKGLQASVEGVIQSAAARGVSLNENPQFQIKSLEQINRDKALLNQMVGRTKAFLRMEYREVSK